MVKRTRVKSWWEVSEDDRFKIIENNTMRCCKDGGRKDEAACMFVNDLYDVIICLSL